MIRLAPFLAILLPIVPAAYGQSAPVPVDQAAASVALPDGFRATLFAGEPDVVQPIAFTTDDRGRLWVCEGMSYPKWQAENTPPADRRDRVLIFEDTNGDGRFDKRTVFADKLINLSGIEFGFGGVFLCSTPSLLFIPDANGDDVPDGPPQVLLNGFSYDISHNVFNGLTWGPDGWLYGMHGILATSKVGPPALPPDDPKRLPINCGVWRVHPVTRAFEVVASGTTNPWGLDFDEMGQMFITNCVIAHAFHIVPGAHYQRMYGEDLSPNVYGLMQTCADHLHWGGGVWTESRGNQPKHSEAGGGHAHVGAMIYLGDNWPDAYRNSLFTCNLHGLRVNNDVLLPSRSGYVAKHGHDFLSVRDSWFRGLDMQYGPDGAVYMSDWSDTDECHDYEDIHRENGRIFKIQYTKQGTERERVNLAGKGVAAMSDSELIRLQSHKNDWFARHAHRVLHERASAGRLDPETIASLKTLLATRSSVPRKLRIIWALHVTGGLDDGLRDSLMSSEDEYVRAWAIRLDVEDREASPEVLGRFISLARSDSSPVVRLHLASAMQRLPLDQRWPVIEALADHEEDADDPNIPLMTWYAVEPMVKADPTRAMRLLETAKIPLLRQHIARRLTSGD
jgi:putative membrane-bound dehydrogenase-like protein